MDTSWKKNKCDKPLVVEGLPEKRLKALEFFLARIDADDKVEDIRHAAYILATVWHETAATFLPIEEYGKGRGRLYGQSVIYKGHSHVYYGRGFVQLTHLAVYLHVGKAIGMGDELACNPELALDYDISYKICSEGMRRGLFTSKKLNDYIVVGEKCDYRHARQIINGMSGADNVAEKAVKMEKMLRNR